MGADIALFPEMWNIGYQIDPDPERLRQHAVPRDGEFVAFFGRLAKTLSMAIGITFLKRTSPFPGIPYASLTGRELRPDLRQSAHLRFLRRTELDAWRRLFT